MGWKMPGDFSPNIPRPRGCLHTCQARVPKGEKSQASGAAGEVGVHQVLSQSPVNVFDGAWIPTLIQGE